MQNKCCNTCVCCNIDFCYSHDFTDTYKHLHSELESFKEALDGVDELVEIVTKNIGN